MESSVSIPITLWNVSKPVFRISTLCISPNFTKLITGSYSGQLCLWDLDLNKKCVSPKNILIGHKDTVTCIASTDEYVISSCEGKMMCRWNLDDGYCSKMNTSVFTHRKMQFYVRNGRKEELLFSCGDYSEIFVIHPFTLQIIYIFHSKSLNMWISSFQVITSQSSQFVSSITTNGCVKLWEFDDSISDLPSETQSYILPITDVLDFNYNSNLTVVLIVSRNCWMLYRLEVQFSNCICRVEASKEEKLLGGNFCENDIIIWNNSGKFYLYNISENKYKQISTFLDSCNRTTVFTPALSLIQFRTEKYLIKGDSQGRISIWKINLQHKKFYPAFSAALADNWVTNENGFFNSFALYSTVTCCIYVFIIDKFFIGCFDGSIISIPTTESLIWFYFENDTEKPLTDSFIGHNGKINCLLYPYEKHSYYDKSHLVSGASDFSVCLWDIFKKELLFKFCVQSGEILRLIVPPENSHMPVKLSICSVSSDHSVALLNLKNQRCLILTSRHEFPVIMVHWKPLDGFIIIECLDGTIYVWQIETGHLDRVLDGVMAQEVIYACSESESSSPALNFYIQESNTKQNSLKQQLYDMCESKSFSPFTLSKFLTNEVSESHMFLCNLENILAQFNYNLKPESLDCAINPSTYLLTKAVNNDLQKKTSTSLNHIVQENEIVQNKLEYSENSNVKFYFKGRTAFKNDKNSSLFSEPLGKLIQFFLSSIHYWELNPNLDEVFSSKLGLLKPRKPTCFGILSQPGIYSLFLPSAENSWAKSSSLFASICVAVITLSKILLSHKTFDEKWTESEKNGIKNLFSFYELASFNLNENFAIPKPNVNIFSKAWQSKCSYLRDIVRKLLSNYLQAMGEKENAELLETWYKYLPHFKILDKTLPGKVDFENVDLKTVALVLFGAVGSDHKFKFIDSPCQENYVYQMCASFVYLLLLPISQSVHFGTLQTIATDFIGRGYILWEQFLKMEKIIPILFKMCASLSEKSFNSNNVTLPSDMCLAASSALKSIAIARTSAFIKCLNNEIAKIKLGQDSHFAADNFKAELLSILIFLLEKTPYIMLLYLSDVISLIVYCVDFTHLRQENLANLIPVIQKFRQVHHSITSQRISVGLVTGSLVLHDLKTGKVHEIPAHKDSVSAVKFSEDGKFLASYSCYENRISFWQILTGMFGLGHVQVKCAKSCQTYQIHDEEIRNHLDIASLTWIDKKSVMLSLCDGSEYVFHF